MVTKLQIFIYFLHNKYIMFCVMKSENVKGIIKLIKRPIRANDFHPHYFYPHDYIELI